MPPPCLHQKSHFGGQLVALRVKVSRRTAQGEQLDPLLQLSIGIDGQQWDSVYVIIEGGPSLEVHPAFWHPVPVHPLPLRPRHPGPRAWWRFDQKEEAHLWPLSKHPHYSEGCFLKWWLVGVAVSHMEEESPGGVGLWGRPESSARLVPEDGYIPPYSSALPTVNPPDWD